MGLKLNLTAVLISLALPACSYSVHQVQAAGYLPVHPQGVVQPHPVQAEAEQDVILGFTGNTEFVEEAYSKLLQSCPHGEIIGLQSRYSTAHHFLSYTDKLVLWGTCLEPVSDAR